MELAKSVNENHFIQILGYSLENLSIYLKYIDYTFIRPDKKLSL